MGGKIKILEKVVVSPDTESTLTKASETAKDKKGSALVTPSDFFFIMCLVFGSVSINFRQLFWF